MKLTTAYIIDGDYFAKRKKELADFQEIHKELNGEYSATLNIRLNEIEQLEEHLKPALPIVEMAFNSGADIMQDELFVVNGGTDKEEFLYSDTTYQKAKQDFITKDF